MRYSNVWWVVASLIAGIYLLSKPNCRHGCRTVAEHLISYGLEGLFD